MESVILAKVFDIYLIMESINMAKVFLTSMASIMESVLMAIPKWQV